MRDLFRTLGCVAFLAAAPAIAQDTAPAEADAAAQAPKLEMGQEETQVGTPYVRAEHGDWELRCVHAPAGQVDPCQLSQLLKDGQGNAVSEINMFVAKNQSGAIAGATVSTPLETLLSQNLRISVDGGKAKVYPFTWCDQAGCHSRVGFTPEDIARFKKGNAGKLTIVPMAAPNQTVDLTISLTGFTAGFDALTALMNEATSEQ